jgi:hypothetical protein
MNEMNELNVKSAGLKSFTGTPHSTAGTFQPGKRLIIKIIHDE